MPRKAFCCCPQHVQWGHKDDAQLRIATEKEKLFCSVNIDGRHKERKRHICQLCRNRIAVEAMCQNLQNKVSLHHDVSPAMCCDGETEIPECSEPIQCCDGETEIPECSEPVQKPSYHDTSTQTGESRLPYQYYESRKKTEIRCAIVNNMQQMLMSYVHNDEIAMRDLLQDVINSRKFKCTFGLDIDSDKGKDEKFLKALAEEYKRCKNKEVNDEIRAKEKQLQQPIKIAGTKGSSVIACEGSTPEQFKSRVEAAKNMGRVNTYGAERRRLLSIVALDYPQSFLTALFNCSKATVTAARVHNILFGRGGVPPKSLKFTRQCVSQDVLDGLAEFLVRDNVSRPSSCRSVVINKEECPVRYWQDSLKNLIQQYLLEFPNGVRRTYIYAHVPKNFRHNSMLAGLCNLCEDYGYANFDNLISLVKMLTSEAVEEDLSKIVNDIRNLQRYLKSEFSNKAQRHSSCLELCMSHALESCTMDHRDHSLDYDMVYQIFTKVNTAISQVPLPARTEHAKTMEDIQKNFSEYIGHMIRTKHQGEYYRYVLNNLKCGEAVVIIDYKMKLELGMHVREIQRDWYGKRGISIHGFYVIAKLPNEEKMIEVLDLWSEDTKQDAWFTQSALDIGFKWMEKALPGFNVYLFSDNGPHYHNTAVLLYLAEVNQAFNFNLLEYNNFEAGEGKTVLDTHFAHISHKLIRWVRVGNNLDSGEQLSELLQSMKNVRCRKLAIDRSKAPSKIGTLKDISLFGNFRFPTTGMYASGIILQSLAGTGRVLKKTSTQLQSLSSRTIPIAGNTGASVTDDVWQPLDRTVRGSSTSGPYSVNFIQQSTSSHPTVPTHLVPLPVNSDEYADFKPLAGFALKKGGAKRVTFTEEQKSIMIYFYDRQKNFQIRANPKDAIAQMRAQGIPELKESQIKSWWGSYHRKQKQLADDLVAEAQQIIQEQDVNSTTHGDDHRSEDMPEASVTDHTAAAPSQTHRSNLPTTPIIGQPSSHTPEVIEWTFQESQSNIGGRHGSNACCFIALAMGSLIHSSNLSWPTNNNLPIGWELTLHTAMLNGNTIHDDFFDFEAVNVQVDDAVAMAGDEFGVNRVADQMDIFGRDPVKQLEDNIKKVVDTAPLPSYSILSAHGLTVLLVVNVDGNAMIIDSHSHGSVGAIISFCKSENVSFLAHWFAGMLQDNFSTTLSIASLSIIEYYVLP